MAVALQPETTDDPLGLNGLIDTINKLTGTTTSGNSSSTTTTTLGGPAAELLKQLTQVIIPQIQKNYYSPDQAKSDSSALIKQAIDEFTKKGLPDIYQQQANSGGYNSTTAQLMANDAEASAAVKGASLASDNISNYAKINQAQINNLTQLVTALAAALKTTSTSASSQQTNGQSSEAAKLAALAGGMLKALRQDRSGSPPAKQKNNTNPNPTSPNSPTGDATKDTLDDGREDNFDNTPATNSADSAINAMLDQNAANSGYIDTGYSGDSSSVMSDILASLSAPQPVNGLNTPFDPNNFDPSINTDTGPLDNIDNSGGVTPDVSSNPLFGDFFAGASSNNGVVDNSGDLVGTGSDFLSNLFDNIFGSDNGSSSFGFDSSSIDPTADFSFADNSGGTDFSFFDSGGDTTDFFGTEGA